MDLNLLLALDALLVERNVTRAARRIGITQPAMSHALGRLRQVLDDPLFVRTPRGMLPTPRAEQLAPQLREALDVLERALDRRDVFDAAHERRTFTLVADDYAMLVVLPALLSRIAHEAPGIDLRVVSMPRGWERALEDGEVDLLLAPGPRPAPAGVRKQRLMADGFVCVMRAGHPASKRPLTLDRFVELRHALIAPGGRAGGVVDTALGALGRERRVVLTVPHFLVAPMIVAETDLVLTLAERIARMFSASLPLAFVKPPLEVPGFDLNQLWHERRQHDPAHQWLRALVAEVSAKRRR